MPKLPILWVCLLAFLNLPAQNMNDPELIEFLQGHTSEQYGDRDFGRFLYVSLQSQCMYLVEDWEIKEVYIISGAKNGPGNVSGSNQTPLGLHKIAEKYGDGVPRGGILKSRIFTKRIADIHTDKTDVEDDHVTTRILWLKGEESGINKGKDESGRGVDSYKRYIYIHGTPEEGLLGTPASHGCIRMVNQAVIELYDIIPVGTYVLILDK